MKIVIDTNILVSAAVAGGKPELVINWIIQRYHCDWIVSDEILAEYQEVLSRPKLKLTETKKLKWLTLIQQSTKPIEVSLEVDFPRDRKDAKFLACAIAAEADFLITGDRDFSEVKQLGETTIISVAGFQELIINSLS